MFNALADAVDAVHPRQIPDLSRAIWQAHAAGQINDDQAQLLADRLHAKSSQPAPGAAAGGSASTPIEIAAQLRAIDRAKIRRRSVDIEAPECRIDGNEATRILVLATAVERKTYKLRAKGQHGGALGHLGIELLRLLMSFGRKYRRIFPRYELLAELLRKDKGTVIAAMKRLIAEGFVTKHRRSKVVQTELGRRRVQDSNAYEVHLPLPGVGAAAVLSFKSSESIKSSVSSPMAQPSAAEPRPQAANSDQFWLIPPYRTAGGNWL